MEKQETVLCIYDENGESINKKIIEVFRKYVLSIVQNGKIQ